MLSPETWNFKPPQHYFSTQKRDFKRTDIPDIVKSHFFNHSISLVLPDTVRIPDDLQSCISEDSDYYRVNAVNVLDLINKEFIEAFVKKGELSLLTIGNKIDVDNAIVITPTGHLILSLLTEDFQILGLEGKASFFDRKANTRYDLGSGSAGWRTSDIEKMIINGVSVMPNLACFILCSDCTDNIIAALAQHCKKLQKLDVTASRSVTERSVLPLLSCKYLTQVKLCRTSMTIPGYANLFLEHLNIQDIGRCDEFGFVLELINKKETNVKSSFHIKIFESRNFSMEHLYLLVDMCPYITSLCLLRDEKIVDLTILATLDYLQELKLLSCDFYTHGINSLLEIKGSTIVSLHLEHVEEIDLNALISISQYCPGIKSLMFYNCEFLERVQRYPRKLAVSPFQSLERIKCVAECVSMHLEFLLSHCTNIKFIQLGSSTGIEDETMRRILLQNPMSKLEELKILYSHDLSMRTIQLLMENCDNLQRLSELENWRGISPAELNLFREELKNTNTNLDTSPNVFFA
ncbi:uncharacterized protein LOC144470966 isoform X2 [Augochlora pura]